jgi:hypothetical protein
MRPSIQEVAEEVLAIQMHYAEKGLSMAQVALAGASDFVQFRHYPKNDLVDIDSGYEMYYHAHPLGESDKSKNLEHGHFHLFQRDLDEPNKFTHLIAISLNQQGLPIKLFTTNQWVTGETIREVKKLKLVLADFRVNTKGRMAPLARWVSGLVHIFHDEAIDLLRVRDQKMKKLSGSGKDKNFFLEDRKHHVLSEVRVNLINKLESLVG